MKSKDKMAGDFKQKKQTTRLLIAAVAVGLLASSATGCNKDAATGVNITPASFKGDPSKMPADARAKMMAAQGSAAQKASAAQKSGGSPK